MGWVRRFVRFHGLRNPAELEAGDVAAFLTHLAVVRHVSAATQNQALAALLFLFQEILRKRLGNVEPAVRAKEGAHVPVVLTVAEVAAVLRRIAGPSRVVAGLLYGSGLRNGQVRESWKAGALRVRQGHHRT